MNSPDSRNPWIWRPKPIPQPRLRLFCFPFAGKGASVFRGWVDRFPATVEMCAIQYPGREQRLREAPFTQMSDLVVAVTEALQESIDVPYVVFGHSVGALAAFEWTRQLRRLGCPGPEHLLVAARRAPHIAERRAPISHFPQAKFVAAICQRYNGIPAEVLKDQELLDLLVPTLRADVQLLESYTYRDEPPLACPITSFGGQEDTEVSALDLGGWQQHTARRCNVRMFPGSHFFLQSAEPAVTAAVADIVTDVLGKPAWFGGGA